MTDIQTGAAPGAGADSADDGDQAARRAQLARLALIVTALVAAAAATGSLPTVAVLGAVIAMIMLHELGHFITAKLGGMKVTEFFLGFGPRLWSIRKGETEYGIKALPLGGYVKIPGMSNLETIDPEDEPRTYRQQSFPRRLAVAVAGSAMHMIIAFVLLMVLFTVVGLPDYNPDSPRVRSISRIEGGPSPAQAAGMKVGDRIVAVDGRPAGKWDDIRRHIRGKAGEPIAFTVERNGRRIPLTVVPAAVDSDDGKIGFIGVGAEFPGRRRGAVQALGDSVRGLANGVIVTGKGLASFFSPERLGDYGDQLLGNAGANRSDDTRFLSPVDLVRVSGQAAESGAVAVLSFLIALNIGVGVFNMVPLLPLDGGHVAIAVYERIRSRKGRRYYADVRKLMPITAVVVGLLVVIVVSSLWLSFTQPMANPFQ